MASIRATLAFARADCIALPCDEDRRLILESVNKPTAMTVNKIISVRVTTRAKPRGWREMPLIER